MVAHRAGVVDDDVGGIAVGHGLIAVGAELAENKLAVQDVHLAAEGLHVQFSPHRCFHSDWPDDYFKSLPRGIFPAGVVWRFGPRNPAMWTAYCQWWRKSALHEAWDPAKYGFLPHPEERYKWWLGKQAGEQNAVFLVADDGKGRLAGFLIGTVEKEIPIYRLKEFGFIHDLWVEEDFRHEGIGRQLVMAAVEKFATLGMKQVRLDTAAANEPARKLFASCGFRVSTVEMLMEM